MAKPNNSSDSKRLLGVIVALVAAVVVFSGWMKFRGGNGVSVRAEVVVRQDIASIISTNGKIEPVNNFEAHAPAPATVKRVLVSEGDYVKAGQPLLQLDDVDARAQAAKALAQLRAAEADLQAVQTGGTQEEVLTNRSGLAKAQAERDEARRNLQAVQRLQQNGGAPPAELSPPPGRTWEGVLNRVPTVVTMVGTRTVGEITCEVQNFDRKLLPNVNVNVSIITARHDKAFTVSRESVHVMDGKRYVYMIVDDKLQSQEVQTGITSLTRVEVVQGLAQGTRIAMGAVNAQTLRNGMTIRVVER